MLYNNPVKTSTPAGMNRIINRILARGNQLWGRLDGRNRPEPVSGWDYSKSIVVYENMVVCRDNQVVWYYI